MSVELATAASRTSSPPPPQSPSSAAAKPDNKPEKVRALRQGQGAETGLTALLGFESRLRQAATPLELIHIFLNDAKTVLPARQIILLQRRSGKRRFQVKAISSVPVIDRDAPFVRYLEHAINNRLRKAAPDQAATFRLDDYIERKSKKSKKNSDSTGDEAKRTDPLRVYPFPFASWCPADPAATPVLAGCAFTAERGFSEPELLLAERLMETFSHAWKALDPHALRPRFSSRLIPPAKLVVPALTSLAILSAGFVQVPLTALAPAEIVAARPFVVAAPIDGVIDRVLVKPNQMVTPRQPLFQFNTTRARNSLHVAENQTRVALAKLKRSTQGAFTDPRARHEKAIAAAEFSLKKAERDYARQLFNKTLVRAETGGLVLFSRKDDWEGKPVRIGQQIMQIARPDRLELRIDLPVGDAIVLKTGTRVKLFLDWDPLHPIEAEIISAGYLAEPTPDNHLAYRVYARFLPAHPSDKSDKQATNDQTATAKALRIGLRGTAQIFGDKVPLYFYLFRRPISAFRQKTGL